MSLTEILSFGGCVDMVVQECNLISKFQERHMHNLPRLNGCGVSNERQYCCLSTCELFFTFNEPFFGDMSLTEVLSFGGCGTWSFKNTSWYRCFQVRHMHNLPRLNSCGVSNERQYCFLSADEICFTFNEPLFGDMSLTEVLSFGGCGTWSFKNTSWYRCFQERHMHNLPRLNGCGVTNERQYCFLSADEIFFTFNEPFFGDMSLTEVLSFGGCGTWSFKNTSWYRCFQVRHMHNLPRLNGCGASNIRQYCFLSADEIFFTFNEPFFGDMSLTEVLSFGGCGTWSFKNTSWYRCFQVRHMHNLPRLNSCGVSNERQYCFLSADEICFTFNEPLFGNMSLTQLLSYGDMLAWLLKNTT